MTDDPLFVPEGGNWLPTGSSRGPWDEGSLHGGPIAALVVRALEALEAPGPMRLARLTVELLRPVPLEPLSLDARVVRPGRKVGMLEAEVRLASDGTLLALARAQRIRVASVDFPDPGHGEPPPLPEQPAAIDPSESDLRTYHRDAVEHRFAGGVFGVPGPAFDWIRLRVPVVPDEEPSPWQRAAAAADFGNGLSGLLPFDGRSLFINPDLTVYLWREPVGEWIGLDAETRASEDGIGMAESQLWDRDGPIGRGLQSLFLDRF